MKYRKTIEIISAILIMLFLYTGGQKVMEHDVFRTQLARQPLPDWLIPTLTWTLPPAELLAAGLLVFQKTRNSGLYMSLTLLSSFTLYTAMAYSEAFGYAPCACGRIFSSMGWGAHLLMNTALLTLNSVAVYLSGIKPINAMNTS